MMALMREAGHEAVMDADTADVFVVNTCTVTMTSDKKSRQLISRVHEKNPDALIAVVGCYAQRAAEEVLSLEGVSLVAGTQERAALPGMIERAVETRRSGARESRNEVIKTLDSRFEDLGAAQTGRTRAHLKIQDGCEQFCTYCVIPHVRGPSRSRPLESVRKEAEALKRQGFQELVLTGIHLASYGREWDDISLLDAIKAASCVPRVRLGSLEPGLITPKFARALAEIEQVCRQFHVSMQSGSETVLRRMGRRYTPAQYAEALGALRAEMPGAAITTDVIAGFPGETEEEHGETLAFAARMAFSRMHVFPYSPRSGTKAAGMEGQLKRSVKHERARALMELGARLTQDYMRQNVGKYAWVLLETHENGVLHGYSETYIPCSVEGPEAWTGRIVRLRLTRLQNDGMSGELVD